MTVLHPVALIFIVLALCVAKWLFFSTKKRNLPPSPRKLPIVGNLLQLGTSPHKSLHSMGQVHGPLMLLRLGSAPTLVVSSPEMAREIMKTHDLIFSNRPDSRIPRRLLYDYKDLSLAPYGEYWRQMRSICVLQLLNAKRVVLFRPAREEETISLVKKIEKSSERPVDLGEMFAVLTNDVVCRVVFGKKYNEVEGGSKFTKLLHEFGALLGVFNNEDFIPWLGWLNDFNGLNSRVEKVFHEFDQFLDEAVEDHIKQGNVDLRDDQMDFVDVLLQIQRTNADLQIDSIKAMILDMFAAGTDTTYTAIE